MRQTRIVLPGSRWSAPGVSRSRRDGGASHLVPVIVLLAGAIAVAGVAACGSYSTCGVRGDAQTYRGSEQYVGTLDLVGDGGSPGPGNGIFGSLPRTASVDWDPYLYRSNDGVDCEGTGAGPGETLVVSAGCALTGTVTSTRFDTGRGASGAFLSATASIDPHQSCTLAVSGGTATVKLDKGTINWDGPSAIRVVLAGTITDWSGSAPRAGYLTYTFDGTL